MMQLGIIIGKRIANALLNLGLDYPTPTKVSFGVIGQLNYVTEIEF